MLLARRRQGEKVIVGDNEVIIEVCEIRGKKVLLGITAPGKTIHREEVFETIQRQKEKKKVKGQNNEKAKSNKG